MTMSDQLIHPCKLGSIIIFAAIALACASESTTDPSLGAESEPAVVGRYTAVDLGTLGGGRRSQATAINAAGQVVGYSELANGSIQHAFIWDKGVMIDLGTLGGNSSRATAISPSGDVYGISATAAGGPAHAFRWSNGRMTDLGLLGGVNETEPRGVNPRGQLAGQTLVPDPSGSLLPHAFVWEKGVLQDLGPGLAIGINPGGQVVGRTSVHAVLWNKTGVAIDLAELGEDGAVAAAINPRGQIVGSSSLMPGPDEPVFIFSHAVMWENGVIRDLGVLGCGNPDPRCNSGATGINPSGQVVGWSETRDAFERAFVWERGVMTDLGTISGAFGSSSRAFAINPRGEVVGSSSTSGGESHATLWRRK
jgi:probable HAF family extracellular repeat protein